MDIDKQNEWNRFIWTVLRAQKYLDIPKIKFKRRLNEEEINYVKDHIKEHYKYAWPTIYVDQYDDHVLYCYGFKGYSHY